MLLQMSLKHRCPLTIPVSLAKQNKLEANQSLPFVSSLGKHVVVTADDKNKWLLPLMIKTCGSYR